MQESRAHLPTRIYQFFLFAYPSEFRREYGPQMSQVFGDSYRDEPSATRVRFWLRILLDLVTTAIKEHRDLRKEKSRMNSTRKDVLALLGSLAMTVAAFLLLTYGRRNEVAAILVFGYALDAIATTGVVGNLIVFGLSKLTRWNPVRIALGTFLVLNAVPALVLLIVGNRIDPHFNHAATLTGYVVSFFFWFGLHWFWSRANMQPQVVD